ncbi:MAG: hypothetical protein IID17_13940 [Nitrospinae bacterium]|nr:hypothetical protein [Nitrospinota bacterium]
MRTGISPKALPNGCYDAVMNPEERKKLKREIVEEIEANKHLIESLAESVKPVAPENVLCVPCAEKR